jgi:succinate dehydrogenase / fumarate reductase cytochrome b subunit
VVLAIWLVALASGREAYAAIQPLVGAGWFKVPLVGWAFCFFYHLVNGVRHLAWDLGLGFEKSQIRASGWTAIVVSVAATAAVAFGAIL